MFDSHDGPDLLPPSVVGALRQGPRPSRGRAEAIASIMAAVGDLEPPRRVAMGARLLSLRPMPPRWALRRGVLSPTGAALAACLSVAVSWLGSLGNPATLRHAPAARVDVAASGNAGRIALRGASLRDSLFRSSLAVAIRDTLRVVRFALDAPAAASVALVGDFTSWGARAVPLRRTATGWTADVALRAGRHRFGFVVDDTGWVGSRSAAGAPRAAALVTLAVAPARFVADTL